MGIPFLIAPYEADAQLAFLVRNGFADCVLTEDSDLLPYGCPLTLLKLAKDMTVDAIQLQDCLNEMQLTHEQFISVCVFSGCDYCSHIRMMGVKTAQKMIQQYKQPEIVIRAARENRKFTVPPGYEREFARAVAVYKHQMVYDPTAKIQRTLTPLGLPLVPDYLGPLIPPRELELHVRGELDTHHGGEVEGARVSPPALLPTFLSPEILQRK
jgi:exonuclease-1